MRKVRFIPITCVLVLKAMFCMGQAPQISYGDYRFLALDSAVIPFLPVNKGGAVPQRVYSQTTTFAGSGKASSLNGSGATAGFNQPSGITAAKNGDLYIADEKNNSIRKITPAGEVSTIATGFNGPSGIAADQSGNLYVADCYNHRICRISPAGIVTTFAGNSTPGNLDNSNGLLARFRYPVSVVTDKEGNVYVCDEGNNKIRKISPGGAVSTLAGSGHAGNRDDQNGKLAEFNQPSGIAIDKDGSVYVADQLNHKIRKISSSGSVSTFAGTGFAGAVNNSDPLQASFNNPRGIAIDATGWIYICDTGNKLIRRISTNKEITTLAGSGAAGSTDNRKGMLSSFFFPNALAANESGLFVADCLSNKIRKIETTGYDVSPSVFPQGISFDYTSGVISGKPVAFFPGQTYLITAYNLSGCSTDTLTLSASTQPGNALNFDGIDDIVVVHNDSVLNPKLLTLEMWVKVGNGKTINRFLLKRNTLPSYDDEYAIGIDDTGHINAAMTSGTGKPGSAAIAYYDAIPIPDKWYFLAVVYSESMIRLYIDGELEAETKTGFPVFNGDNGLFFNFDRSSKMTVDEVRLFNYDRSASIGADMTRTISPNEPGLMTYYDFNMGTATGRNSAYNTLYDGTTHANNGELQQFFHPATGAVSNWVESYAMVVPANSAVSDITPHGFTARWSAPVMGKADHYLLEVAIDRQFTQTLEDYRNKIVHGMKLQIEGLKPGTEYFFRVRACKPDSDEEGGYSQVIKLITDF